MYRFTTFWLSICRKWAFKTSKICYFCWVSTFFCILKHFKCLYLANGKLKGSQPIHFWKIDNEDLTLKKIVLKNMQVEANDVIFKMADIWPKMQISRERFIQFWQSIPFFSSSNRALYDGTIHFSKGMGEKIDVVRVPPLKSWHFTPCKRPPSKNRFWLSLGLGLSDD